MPLLFYWRYNNYVQDLGNGASYHLNSKQEVLHDVERGDSVWAITHCPDGRYALAAELVVHSKTRNAPGYKYGPYRVWGDIGSSQYFQLDAQPDQESVIRNLSVKTDADQLYHSFMGPGSVRRLTEADHRMLVAAAQDFPTEPDAELLPEETLESALYQEDREAVAGLVREATHGLSSERQRTITRTVPERNRTLVERLQRMYDGRCQVCRWDPVDEYGKPLCEGHHIQWLSRGGDDALDNLMLVCPNHHRAIHRCDAPLDWGRFELDFGTHREAVALDRHLAAET
jgi:hypothetical protein